MRHRFIDVVQEDRNEGGGPAFFLHGCPPDFLEPIVVTGFLDAVVLTVGPDTFSAGTPPFNDGLPFLQTILVFGLCDWVHDTSISSFSSA